MWYNIGGGHMKKIPILLIKLYQKLKIRQVRYCRHEPTCSNYALEAYQKHNFFYATFLTTRRILTCNPLFKGKYDPVPEPKKRIKAKGN